MRKHKRGVGQSSGSFPRLNFIISVLFFPKTTMGHINDQGSERKIWFRRFDRFKILLVVWPEKCFEMISRIAKARLPK